MTQRFKEIQVYIESLIGGKSNILNCHQTLNFKIIKTFVRNIKKHFLERLELIRKRFAGRVEF